MRKRLLTSSLPAPEGVRAHYASDGKVEKQVGGYVIRVPAAAGDAARCFKLCICGEVANHSFWRPGYGEEGRCCRCHVLVDKAPPANWHPECMKAHAELRA